VNQPIDRITVCVARQCRRDKTAEGGKAEHLTGFGQLQAKMMSEHLLSRGFMPAYDMRFCSEQLRAHYTAEQIFPMDLDAMERPAPVMLKALNNLTSTQTGDQLRTLTYRDADKKLGFMTDHDTNSDPDIVRARLMQMLHGQCSKILYGAWVARGFWEIMEKIAQKTHLSTKVVSRELQVGVVCHTWWGDLFDAWCRFAAIKNGGFLHKGCPGRTTVDGLIYSEMVGYGDAVKVTFQFSPSEIHGVGRVLSVERIRQPLTLPREQKLAVNAFMGGFLESGSLLMS